MFTYVKIPQLIAVAVAAVLSLTGCTQAGDLPAGLLGEQPAHAVTTKAGGGAAGKLTIGFSGDQSTKTAKAKLAALKVASPAAMTGYSREKFPHWRDASSWGWPTAPNDRCNTRNAALYRDGKNVTMSKTCTSLKGTWLDPYTGKTYTKASEVDIDHLVPLAEAWRSGAAKWSTDQRTRFANDSLVAIAVQASANRSKGDKDPSAWRPANKDAHCLYAKRWIAIKDTYKLNADPAEKTALDGMLATC